MRLIAAALCLLLFACDQQMQELPKRMITITRQNGEIMRLSAEIADNDMERATGLMHRNYLPEDKGMLFVFDKAEPRSFWMHETRIPLDMLFTNAEGVIVHIHRNAVPFDETPISSRFPAQMVLEINGGMAKRWYLKEGDTIKVEKGRDSQ